MLCGDLNVDSNEMPYLMTKNSCLKNGSRQSKESQEENKKRVHTELDINENISVGEVKKLESSED